MKCYLCGNDTAPLFRKSGYIIYRCPRCGLGQTDLKKNYDSFITGHYGKGYFTGDPRFGAYVDYKRDKLYIVRNMRKILQKIRRIIPNGRLLDVGCAMGHFVELTLKSGYDAYGLDPSEFAVGKATPKIRERLTVGTTRSITHKYKSFDVITMLDVFEHLKDPAADLRILKKLLSDKGIIVIATGDAGSFMAKLLGRRWTFYSPPQHLFFFNKSTLFALLRQEGLEPISMFRVGKWLSLRYMLHLARTGAESPFAEALYPLVQKLGLGTLPLFLPLRDNMVVIARKKA